MYLQGEISYWGLGWVLRVFVERKWKTQKSKVLVSHRKMHKPGGLCGQLPSCSSTNLLKKTACSVVFSPLSKISWLYSHGAYFWVLFSVAMTYLYILSSVLHYIDYYSFIIRPLLKIRLSSFLMLSYVASLYILNIWFRSIVSLSVDWLFILLIFFCYSAECLFCFVF